MTRAQGWILIGVAASGVSYVAGTPIGSIIWAVMAVLCFVQSILEGR